MNNIKEKKICANSACSMYDCNKLNNCATYSKIDKCNAFLPSTSSPELIRAEIKPLVSFRQLDIPDNVDKELDRLHKLLGGDLSEWAQGEIAMIHDVLFINAHPTIKEQ